MSATNTDLELDSDVKDATSELPVDGGYQVVDLRASTLDASAGWMSKLLLNREFQMVPAANLQAMFARFTPMNCEADQVVVQQGNDGEFFYVVTDGRCKVSRKLAKSERSITLAELGVGDTFGEEALITGSQRQATVTMITKGTVMKLSKDDFKELLSDPIITFIDEEQAEKIVAAGGQWLDVGISPQQESAQRINVAHIPMQILRHKCRNLDKEQHHVVTCNEVTHSCAAAHVLRQDGFLVSVLATGSTKI